MSEVKIFNSREEIMNEKSEKRTGNQIQMEG